MRHTFKLALAIVACMSVFSFAAIPTIRITTQNNQEPSVTTICTGQNMCFGGTCMCMGSTSTNMNYVKVNSFALEGAGSYNFTSNGQDSIRVRGNSTADADKKPYRIKFGEKKSMFGLEAAKSWVLLAEYYDGTFSLNAIAFRLGQKMGLEFTHNARLVEVYVNNQNKGIYTLTEQNQVNPGRVDIRDKKDWLVEFDYHPADADEIKFNTTRYNLPTFIKSPEVESQFNVNNPNIKFVVDELNALTNKMFENNFPENGYRNMLDLDSWAKYVLIQQLMDNFDFNSKVQDQAAPGSNFCYRDSTGKVKAGPLWDFDLSAGVTAPGQIGGIGGMGTFPAHYQTTTEPVEPKHTFYKRLYSDPVFKAKFKKLFDKHKSDFDAIPALIDSISGALKSTTNGSVNWSSNKWANNSFGTAANLTQDQHNSEVTKLKAWWTSRVSWFGSQIANFDTSKDIEQTATVTVTFDAMNGNPTPATQTVAIGQKATQPTNPTRNGYTFGGWFKDGGNSTGTFVEQWNFNTDVVTGKLTLYAKWTSNNGGGPNPPDPPQPQPTNYTVTFNTLSNSASPAPQAQTVEKDGKATEPPAMTRQPEGTWTFGGWYRDNGNWQQKWDFNTDVVTADVILYAYWKSTVSYTVTFNTNGGSNVASQSVLEGEKATQPTTDPTREGFIFSGWYKDAGTNNVWNFDTEVINNNTTIYAKWSEQGNVTYTVTFNTNSSATVPSQSVAQGAKATKPADPVRTGYVFDGWYKDAGTNNVWNFDTEVINNNTTIYAKWTKTFTVIFNTNNGNNIPTQTVAQGTKVTRPNNPTRSGYTFDGWYKEAALTTAWNFDSDVVNANITIYAKWSVAATVTVTFNTNGGSSISTQTVNNGAKVTKPPEPTRSEYTFNGWYKNSNLTVEWNFDTDIVSANTTIYAKWTEHREEPEPPSFAMVRPQQFKSLTAIKNGFIINSGNNVSMTVFNLNGNVVRKAAFASGNHTVKLEDLPKGMYIVKASFGNGTTPVILRLPIR